MLKQIRLGLIGCGVIGQVHLRLAPTIEGAAFAAVCDLREEAARASEDVSMGVTAQGKTFLGFFAGGHRGFGHKRRGRRSSDGAIAGD